MKFVIRGDEKKVPAGSAGGGGLRREEESVGLRMIAGGGCILAVLGGDGARDGRMAVAGCVMMMPAIEGLQQRAKTARRRDPHGQDDMEDFQHEG